MLYSQAKTLEEKKQVAMDMIAQVRQSDINKIAACEHKKQVDYLFEVFLIGIVAEVDFLKEEIVRLDNQEKELTDE